MKSYDFLGKKIYIYWNVCDELGIPKEKGFRRKFHRQFEIGEFGKDKFTLSSEDTLKGILKDDYRFKKYGFMFITEEMKNQLETAWKVFQDDGVTI